MKKFGVAIGLAFQLTGCIYLGGGANRHVVQTPDNARTLQDSAWVIRHEPVDSTKHGDD